MSILSQASAARCLLLLLLAPLSSLVACGTDVHIELVAGADCDAAIMEWESVLSGNAQLRRVGDGLTVQSSCIGASSPLRSVDDLEGLFRGTVVFNDLPAEGNWTVRVRGYFSETCVSKTTLACGRVDGVDLAGASTIVVPVDCAPRVSTDPPAAFKRCTDEL